MTGGAQSNSSHTLPDETVADYLVNMILSTESGQSFSALERLRNESEGMQDKVIANLKARGRELTDHGSPKRDVKKGIALVDTLETVQRVIAKSRETKGAIGR